MQGRRVLLIGVLFAGAAVLGTIAFGMLSFALLIAAVQVVGAGGILCLDWFRRRTGDQVTPAGPTPEERVERVLATNRSIEELSRRVRSSNLQRSLLRGCELVPEILDYTGRRDRDHLASTAAQIGTYLQSVHTALTQYVDKQDNPGPDTPRMLHQDGKVLGQFPTFMLTSREQLEAGDAAVYRANLKVLQPMTLRGISS